MERRPSYNHNAGFYRSVQPDDDLSKPWESTPFTDFDLPLSPFKPVFDLPKFSANKITPEPSSSSSEETSPTIVSVIRLPPKEKGVWARIRRFLRSGTFSLEEKIVIPVQEPPAPETSKVELCEWKQYGYWARPWVNDIVGWNSPVTSEKSIDTIALKEMIISMREDEATRSTPPQKRFKPGSKHRALPPRPERWKDPVPGVPLPFPWEVQINPLLQHVLWGPSPISWRLYINPESVCAVRYGRTYQPVYCGYQDFAQPATYPFLTHMYVNAVAGDSAPSFPWPFCIQNPKGIKMGEVLTQIYLAFQEPVLRDECMSWPMQRQEAAKRALEDRCLMSSLPNQPWTDVMRRCDALGGIMYFRGIEATINGGGWMITFGAY